MNEPYFDPGMTSPCLRYFAKRFDEQGYSLELLDDMTKFMGKYFHDPDVGLVDAEGNWRAVGY